MLAAKPETNEISGTNEASNSFTTVTVEFACEEARRLGQTFTDTFLKIKRLVQDQPTYNSQIDIFSAFRAELLFPDQIITELEKLIEWNEPP